MSHTVERVMPGTDSWKEYGEEHIQRYRFFDSYYNNRRVADAACGTGYGSDLIAASGATNVLGIDVSKEAVDFAGGAYRRDNLQYREWDCARINELDEKFDLVVSFETIEHLDEPETFTRNVAASLDAGGLFICSTPNKARLSGAGHFNPFHPNELEFSEFKRLFEKYFSVSAIYHQSESTAYLRYLELKHLLHQERARNNSFLFNRFELLLRRLFQKHFSPIPFFHDRLSDQHPGDLVIETLEQALNWHKTFILVGTVKAK